MISPAWPNPHRCQAPAPPLTSLSDDLLVDILIRLPTLADLGRAAAACPTFRRVIADRSFLRRIRAVHPPLLLGILSGFCGPDFLPAQPPHPSADAADFSCSFLPSPDRWRYRDFRDGRALLSKLPEGSFFPPGDYGRRALVKEFTVCDLLHRRYRLLPAIPVNLLGALVDCWDIIQFDAFLAPSSEDEDEDEDEGGTSLRVICLAVRATALVAFTFSSGSEQWHATEFDGWSALTSRPGPGNPHTFSTPELPARDYAHGCFCWAIHERNKLLVLNARTMNFSFLNIPPSRTRYGTAIVEAGEGRFGMFIVCVDRRSDTCKLSYTVLRNDVHSANQWQSGATIQLPQNYHYNILGVAGGYLLLQGIPDSPFHDFIPVSEKPNLYCFSLNLKTFLVESFSSAKSLIFDAPKYVGLPPSLSPPTI